MIACPFITVGSRLGADGRLLVVIKGRIFRPEFDLTYIFFKLAAVLEIP